jgi:hypothetical protein
VAESVRERILANIAEALRGISRQNGYETDVARVEREHRDFTGEDFPLLVVSEPDESYEESPNDLITVMMQVMVRGTLRMRGSDKSTPIGALMQDVYAALIVDPKRGGGSVNCYPLSSKTAVDESDGLWGHLQYVWQVHYRHERLDPTVAR